MSSSSSTSIPSIYCRCGMRAKIRHSTKERSLERAFYGCPNYISNTKSGCGFFVWAEDWQRMGGDGRSLQQRKEDLSADIEKKLVELQKSLDSIGLKIEKEAKKLIICTFYFKLL